MAAFTVQVRQRGTITIPRVLRRKYQLGEGDVFTYREHDSAGCYRVR